jgi:hypothetical protein
MYKWKMFVDDIASIKENVMFDTRYVVRMGIIFNSNQREKYGTWVSQNVSIKSRPTLRCSSLRNASGMLRTDRYGGVHLITTTTRSYSLIMNGNRTSRLCMQWMEMLSPLITSDRVTMNQTTSK